MPTLVLLIWLAYTDTRPLNVFRICRHSSCTFCSAHTDIRHVWTMDITHSFSSYNSNREVFFRWTTRTQIDVCVGWGVCVWGGCVCGGWGRGGYERLLSCQFLLMCVLFGMWLEGGGVGAFILTIISKSFSVFF